MLPCVMVGDSLAVGVGQARPECEVFAQVGITSGRYLADYLPRLPGQVDTAVISLGVNDDATVHTLDNLRQVRSRLVAKRVFWLLPGLKPEVRAIIRTVAAESGDRWIDTAPEAGRDHLHPTSAGYRQVASVIDAGPVEVAAAPAIVEDPPAAPGGRHRRHGHGRHAVLLTSIERVHLLREMRRHERTEERGHHGHRPAVRLASLEPPPRRAGPHGSSHHEAGHRSTHSGKGRSGRG